MQSVNSFIELSCSLLRETTRVWLLQFYFPNLTGSGGIKRLCELLCSIDFSHSSRKAWSIWNNLTGSSRHSPCHCPVSADAIAFQQVKNGRYKVVEGTSFQLVGQEVSDLG